VLAGASPQALEVEGISARTAQGWRSAYGSMSRAARERAAGRLVRFGPDARQILGALALVAAGVALTRALGARGGGRAGPRAR
jgi:hypothetical protein